MRLCIPSVGNLSPTSQLHKPLSGRFDGGFSVPTNLGQVGAWAEVRELGCQ